MAPPSKPKKPGKSNRNHPNDAASSLPLQIEDDAPDFPRGGGSFLSGAAADEEFETDQRVLKKRKKEKRVQNRNQSTLGSTSAVEGIAFTPTDVKPGMVVKPGSLVSGVVERITEKSIVVDVDSPGHMQGTISLEHLADHHDLAVSLMSAIKHGYHFDQLLVLGSEGNDLVLTAKYSLVNSTQELPADVRQLSCHTVVPGYICNITETGCSVRYIGRLTGFAPKSKATDNRWSDLSEVFYIGQSVRSYIIEVDSETGSITLSLKQSLCSSNDASFIQEYFLLDEKIAKLQGLDSEDSELRWINGFGICNCVEGKVLKINNFGVKIGFEKYSNVYGFISQYQLDGRVVENNSVIQAAVLNVSKINRLVDLSLKPEFVNKSSKESSTIHTAKKKRKREACTELEVNQTVNAIVEIVNENYLVLSLPAHNFTVGYASPTDYNTQRLGHKQFTPGESISATVMALPAPENGGRLLLLLKSLSDAVETSGSKQARKKSRKKSRYNVGSLIQAEITEINPLELKVKFGSGFHGRIHVAEATDDNSAENLFSNYRIGQILTARIVSKDNKPETEGGYGWELSIKPSMLKDTNEEKSKKKKKKARKERGQEISADEVLDQHEVDLNNFEKCIQTNRNSSDEREEVQNDFEKCIQTNPNSSHFWKGYIAYMQSMGDVENARSIAERALQTIDSESEKLNIWVAYFNLEITLGKLPKEAFTELFERALQTCKPKKVYLALLQIYEQKGENILADELLHRMARKFKQSCKIRLRKIQSLLEQKREVQRVVDRALKHLPPHKHVKFISKTAILEFKYEPDWGRSRFDTLLSDFPENIDIWSDYLDQEIALGDADLIRKLFEKATSLSLCLNKMKILFKKHLEYEERNGDEERIGSVKKKAEDYLVNILDKYAIGS